MAELCACDGGLSSLNRKRDCKTYLKKAVHVLPIQRHAQGNRNHIDLSTIPVPESVFKDMFTAESSARIHVIYDVKNTAFEPQDGTTEDWADGTSTKLTDGQLQMTFIVPETDIGFIGNSSDLECRNPDLFLYTADGSIVGYGDRDTISTDKKLYPLPVDRWEIVEVPLSTDDQVAKVTVTIFFDRNMSYKKWIVMNANEHDFNESENYEAIDANLAFGTVTTSSAEVVVTLDGFGIDGNSVPLTGLGASDFVVNVAGNPESVLTAVESPTGTYLLTFSAGTSGDTITVKTAPSIGYVSEVVSDVLP